MRLSSLKDRAIININNGERMGTLAYCDLSIDENDGKILALLVPKRKLKVLFSNESDHIEIPWDKIVKIGIDTIMVDI